MAAILHFDWDPTTSTEARPVDSARAIKRGDTFARTIRFWTDDTKTTPRVMTGTFLCQLRAKEIGPTNPAEPVVAEVTVDDTDAATGVLVLRMEPTVTVDLPKSGFWDLQNDVAGVVTTLIGGKFATDNDVSRAP